MKKLATFTTAALLAVSLMGGGASANAADGGTIYPEDEKFIKVLAFDSLGDYAVDGEKYAFADGKSVKVYENGEYFEYAFGDAVTKVDISEGEILRSAEKRLILFFRRRKPSTPSLSPPIPSLAETSFTASIKTADSLPTIWGKSPLTS